MEDWGRPGRECSTCETYERRGREVLKTDGKKATELQRKMLSQESHFQLHVLQEIIAAAALGEQRKWWVSRRLTEDEAASQVLSPPRHECHSITWSTKTILSNWSGRRVLFSSTKSFPGDIDILLCSQPIVLGLHAVRKNYAWKYDNVVSYRNFSFFFLHHSATCMLEAPLDSN